MSGMTRKEFFQEILGWGAGLFGGGPDRDAGQERGLDPALAGLAADFPDALLHEEARRLGLDPATAGREEMLRAVFAAMRPPGAAQEG